MGGTYSTHREDNKLYTGLEEMTEVTQPICRWEDIIKTDLK
jgi:hypothetical protein